MSDLDKRKMAASMSRVTTKMKKRKTADFVAFLPSGKSYIMSINP